MHLDPTPRPSVIFITAQSRLSILAKLIHQPAIVANIVTEFVAAGRASKNCAQSLGFDLCNESTDQPAADRAASPIHLTRLKPTKYSSAAIVRAIGFVA